MKADAHIVALIKPQFEAGRDRVSRGGVVRDPIVHADVLRSILNFAPSIDLKPIDLIRSPIEGPAGNVEFLVWLRNMRSSEAAAIEQLVQAALTEMGE